MHLDLKYKCFLEIISLTKKLEIKWKQNFIMEKVLLWDSSSRAEEQAASIARKSFLMKVLDEKILSALSPYCYFG